MIWFDKFIYCKYKTLGCTKYKTVVKVKIKLSEYIKTKIKLKLKIIKIINNSNIALKNKTCVKMEVIT